jgi:hypothetical protein
MNRTGNFIGCTAVDVSPQSLTVLLEQLSSSSSSSVEKEDDSSSSSSSSSSNGNTQLLNHNRTLALTLLDGTVVAGAGWDSRIADSRLHWSDTFTMKNEDPTTFDRLVKIFSQWMTSANDDEENKNDDHEHDDHNPQDEWNINQVRQDIQNNFQALSDGTVLFAQPIPSLPTTNDNDLSYEPQLLLISSSGLDLLTAADDIDGKVDDDVQALIRYTMMIGISGLVAILLSVWLVSILLTKPLQWMEEVAWRIVNHSDERAGEEFFRDVVERRGIRLEDDDEDDDDGQKQQHRTHQELMKKEEHAEEEQDNDETSSCKQEDVAPENQANHTTNNNNNRGSSLTTLGGGRERKFLTRFTPRTEITELVAEFQSMIHGFSGKGAGKVANPLHHEVKNCVTWQNEFQQLYDRTGEGDSNNDRMGNTNNNSNGNGYGNNGNNSGADGAGGKSNNRMSFARRLSTNHRRPSVSERRESFARRLSDHRENSAGHSTRSMDRDWRELLGSCVDDDYDENDKPIDVGVVKSAASMSEKEGSKSDRASSVKDHASVKEEEEGGNKNAATTTTTTLDGHGVSESRRSPENYRESRFGKDEDSAQFRSAEHVLRMSATLQRPAFSAASSASLAESRNSVSEVVSKMKFESESRFESTFSQEVAEQRMNKGSNLWDGAPAGDVSVASGESNTFHRGGHSSRIKSFNILEENPVKMSRSSLFRWIVGLIAVPLLLTNALICYLVARDILQKFPNWVALSQNASLEFELESLRNLVYLRSKFVEHELAGPIRDLFLVTRVAGWLLFDAIDRSDSFTTLETEFSEECKVYPDDETCPYFTDDSRSPCDCKWNDPWTQQCTNFDNDTRPIQKAYFLGQARDADNVTGNRLNASSFPALDYSPETTLWWNNLSELPGAYKGRNASGYETTYDRVRVISALAVVSMPVYNYATTARSLNNHTAMSSNVFFEMDGSVWGYSGCYVAYGHSVYFQSSEDNRAFLIEPDLCPLHKFGYDGRCRSFYADGKRSAVEERNPMYITEPYRYAIGNADIGSSALAPLIDPRNKTLVGQTLIDFSPVGMIQALDRTRSYFYTVISTRASDTSDTLAGPDHSVGDDPASITYVVLPNDLAESTNRKIFSRSVLEMKQGKRGDVAFHRKNTNDEDERIRLAYAPVHAMGLSPVRADDFTRGVLVKEVLLYSLGVARLEESLTSPFDSSEDDINEALGQVAMVYLILVGLLSVLCMAFTAKVSTSFLPFLLYDFF